MKENRDNDLEDKILGLMGRLMKNVGNVIHEVGELHKTDREIIDIIRKLDDALENKTKNIDQKVDALYQVMKSIGEKRTQDCIYSRDGYCSHPINIIENPSQAKIHTAKINGKYYPAVSWSLCYPCTAYQGPPS